MPELNIDQEMARTLDNIREEIEEARPVPTAGAPIMDAGAEAMMRAGELSVKALRESFAEAAKRTLEIGEEAVKEALEKQKQCKEDAERLLDYGDRKATEFLDLFTRNKNASLTLSQALAILAVPEKLSS